MYNPYLFNVRKAEEVLMLACQALEDRTHLYAVVHEENAPQHKFVPKNLTKGSSEHILFLFFTMLTTLRSKSVVGFERMSELYDIRPELFTTDVIELGADAVLEGFRIVKVPFQNVWAEYWIDCATSLKNGFRSDLAFLISEAQRKGSKFDIIEGFVEIKKELKKAKKPCFNGYGEKLFSLFCICCEELGLVQRVHGALPVDVHLQSICLSTRIVTIKRDARKNKKELYSDTLAKFLRRKLAKFCIDNNIPESLMSHALWILGSSGCVKCERMKNVDAACPVVNSCSGRWQTGKYFSHGRWYPEEEAHYRGHPGLFGDLLIDFEDESNEKKESVSVRQETDDLFDESFQHKLF